MLCYTYNDGTMAYTYGKEKTVTMLNSLLTTCYVSISVGSRFIITFNELEHGDSTKLKAIITLVRRTSSAMATVHSA